MPSNNNIATHSTVKRMHKGAKGVDMRNHSSASTSSHTSGVVLKWIKCAPDASLCVRMSTRR